MMKIKMNCQFPTSRPPCALGWPKNGSRCHSCGIHGTSSFGALRQSSAWSTIRRKMLESSASMTLVRLAQSNISTIRHWSWGHWQWQLQMTNNDVTDWQECCFCAGGFVICDVTDRPPTCCFWCLTGQRGATAFESQELVLCKAPSQQCFAPCLSLHSASWEHHSCGNGETCRHYTYPLSASHFMGI